MFFIDFPVIGVDKVAKKAMKIAVVRAPRMIVIINTKIFSR